jgi:hypothetical protein
MEETSTWSLEDLNRIATPELSYIADDAYHYTLIEIARGSSKAKGRRSKKAKGFVKLHRTPHHHYRLEFIGIDCPPELSGTWTMNNMAVRAIRSYCEARGWTMTITHISKDGKALSVNLKAI